MSMYFVVSAGGTAGHINPALAVADELRGRGHEVAFVGTDDRMEARLVPEAGFPFTGLSVAGFDKAKPWTLLSSAAKLLSATKKVEAMFATRHPDAVLGFGAYVSIPVGRAAHAMQIPLVIHEQNSVPGMANDYLARRADVTALTYEASREFLKPAGECIVCGNPVRKSVEENDRAAGRAMLGVGEDATVVLVTGGSLGAHRLNAAVCALKEQLLAIDGLVVVHSSGAQDLDFVKETLALSPQEEARWKVFPYIEHMGKCMAACDFAVSRAGASSLAELATLHVPAILVPYPHARGDHQTLNARAYVDSGAAVLVADADVEGVQFSSAVLGLAGDAQRRATMRKACEGLSGADARRTLADVAVRLAKK